MIKTIPRVEDTPTGKMLRLLKKNGGFVEKTNGQETIHSKILGDNHHSRKEIETAWLEKERNEARALMELQRRRFIC